MVVAVEATSDVILDDVVEAVVGAAGVVLRIITEKIYGVWLNYH